MLASLFMIGLLIQAHAQVDRTKAPAPGPAPEVKLGEYQSFTLKNGLQVFVVENHKLPRVQFSMELKNNPILEGEKAGYVSMAGDLMRAGTTTRSKAQLDEEVDFIGASLNTHARGIFAASLSSHTDKLLDLMTDVLYHPAFPEEELEKQKTQLLSTLAANKEDPGSIATNVRDVLFFGEKHPYGEIVTEETVKAITLSDCKQYYQTYFKPGNAYLAMVGDITLKQAKKLAKKYFAKWAEGTVPNPTYTIPTAPAHTRVALVDRPSAVQSVVRLGYPLPLKPGAPEVINADVMNQILGVGFSSRLMQNLREDKAFTYGARSSLSADPLVAAFSAVASVRNEVTDSAVHEFLYEMERIRKAPVTDEELMAAKASISGAFGRSLEKPQTVASFAINTAKYNLPEDYYAQYLKKIAAVSKSDVTAAANQFILPDHTYIIVVGKGADIAEKLEKFGEVSHYDIYGKPYTPTTAAELPAGITAEKVMADYLKAIGGAEKAKEVTSMKIVYKTEAMGMQLTRTDLKKGPAKSVVEVESNGQLFSKIVCDGKNASVEMMGRSLPVEEAMQEVQMFEGVLFRELAYEDLGATVALKGISPVNGQDAYVLEYTLTKGEQFLEFYDCKTGLKVQTSQTVKTPQGEMSITRIYSDYKTVEGIKIPFTITQNGGPMNMTFEATEATINPPLADDLFSVK